METILDFINNLARITKGTNAESFYANQVARATTVKITRISELQDSIRRQLDLSLRNLDPKPKECYKNAQQLVLNASYRNSLKIDYVEGYYSVCSVPIEHAFNKITFEGKVYYIDITAESQGFPNDSIDENYVVCFEASSTDVLNNILNKQVYTSLQINLK